MIQAYSSLMKSAAHFDLHKCAEIANKMRGLVKTGGRSLPNKVVAYYVISDTSFEDVLEEKGIPVKSVRTLTDIGTIMGGNVRRISYLSGGVERVALALPLWGDIDSFADEVLIYNKGDEPIDVDEIENAFLTVRQQEKKSQDQILKELESLDKQVPPMFRQVIFSSKSQEVALNIYRAKGVLNLSVFEPFKGTLAYPKTEQEAIGYFERPHASFRVPKETYLLVGELLDKGLLIRE